MSDALIERAHTDGKMSMRDGKCKQCFSAHKFDGYKADIASLRKEGKTAKEVDVVFSGLCRLLGILIAILLEKGDQKDQQEFQHPSIAARQG